MQNKKRKRTFYEIIIKRPMDFILSLIAIIILSPVMMVVAILVRTKLGKPILFKQARSGGNEKKFNMYKFRSMTNDKDHNGKLLADDQRLTKFGKLLRSTSLDELPNLFNIITGKMSIVGPRPHTLINVAFMTKDQKARHLIRPGLTGLAQVNGRNAINWDDKLNYDLEYLNKITFLKDLKIIIKTFFIVLKRSDINQQGMETNMELGEYLLYKGEINIEKYNQVTKIIEVKNKSHQILFIE